MMGSPIYLFIYLLTYLLRPFCCVLKNVCVCVCVYVSGMPGVPSCRETPFLQVVLNEFPVLVRENQHPMKDGWMDG
jgi:hypothetical protein